MSLENGVMGEIGREFDQIAESAWSGAEGRLQRLDPEQRRAVREMIDRINDRILERLEFGLLNAGPAAGAGGSDLLERLFGSRAQIPERR